MNKRIVLKSVAAVVMAGFILCASSCEKEKPKENGTGTNTGDGKDTTTVKEHAIVGMWEYETIKIQEIECEEPLMAIMIQTAFQESRIAEQFEEIFGGTYDFTKNGKVIHLTDEGSVEGSYTIDGNKLTISDFEGLAGTFDFSIANKKMYLDISLFDMTEIAAQYGLGSYLDMILSMGVTKCIMRISFAKQ